MNAHDPITITPVRVADLLAEDARMPVYVHVIDHPDARVLVDTGITELHPAVADLDPRLRPLSKQDFDLAGTDIVVNTHLHFDHCGGNHLLAGRPIYVQRRELDDARSEDGYTIREWVEAPGVRYVPVDGELELLPGLRLVPAPGHTRGMQVLVVETGGGPVVVGRDAAGWLGEVRRARTHGAASWGDRGGGIGVRALQRPGEGAHGAVAEQQPQRYLDTERLAQPGPYPGGEQRVPAEGEEVVVHADPIESERVGPHGGDQFLGDRA